MSEILDPKNVAFFAAHGEQTFGAVFSAPKAPAHGVSQVETCRKVKASWHNTERWGTEKALALCKKTKMGKIVNYHSRLKIGKSQAWGLDLAGEDTESLEEKIAQAGSVLDRSLVARYHELSNLDAQGVLSSEGKAELAEVQRRLDDQERASVLNHPSGSTLEEDIERLKQLIELNRELVSVL